MPKPKQTEEPFDHFQQYYKDLGPELTTSEAVKQFLWNPKTGEIFGRTPSSWSEYIFIHLFNLIV